MAQSYLEANPDLVDDVHTLKQLIISTISYSERCLDIALECQLKQDKRDDILLLTLRNEQLPKLKGIFDMPTAQQPVMRQKPGHIDQDFIILRKSQEAVTFHAADSASTPKTTGHATMTKQASTLSESSNRSFLKHLTIQAENYTGRALISYLTGGGLGNSSNANSNNTYSSVSNDKLANQLSFTSRSHRDSVGSIKSINSEDVFNNTQSTNGETGRAKIILGKVLSFK
jgi:hypothetical protein